MKVVKVGGGVLFEFESIAALPDVLAPIRGPYVLVVSAFGKTTNALECVARSALEGDTDGAMKKAEDTLSWHADLAARLRVSNAGLADSSPLRSVVERALRAKPLAQHRAAFRDEILSFGEQWSSHLVAASLRRCGLFVHLIDATDVVVTDDNFGAAAPIRPLTDYRIQEAMKPPLRAGEMPLIAGFVGATRQGARTTLGREGSDYTAALVASALDAEELVLLKSVDGVMSADPSLVRSARLIPSLSFDQAERLFKAGAKVVHPKTIGPVREKEISVHVKRFGTAGSGTLMSSRGTWEPGTLHAVVARSTTRPWEALSVLPSLLTCGDAQTVAGGSICLTVVGEPPIPGHRAATVESTLREVGCQAVLHDSTLSVWHGWVASTHMPHALRVLHDRVCLGLD